jgi:hypothetical protein
VLVVLVVLEAPALQHLHFVITFLVALQGTPETLETPVMLVARVMVVMAAAKVMVALLSLIIMHALLITETPDPPEMQETPEIPALLPPEAPEVVAVVVAEG